LPVHGGRFFDDRGREVVARLRGLLGIEPPDHGQGHHQAGAGDDVEGQSARVQRPGG